MIGSRAYWLLFATRLALSVFGAGMADRADGDVPVLLQAARPNQGSRTVQDLVLDPSIVVARSAVAGPELKGPLRVEVEPGVSGHVFLVDDGAADRILEYEPSGRWRKEHRPGNGTVVLSVSDLAVQADAIWVADLLAGVIHRIDRASGTWSTVTTEVEPYRIEPIEGTERLLVAQAVSSNVLTIVDRQGVVQWQGQPLVAERHALALDGYITRAGDGFAFVGKHWGLVASFRHTGALRHVSLPIAAPPTPRILRRDETLWLQPAPLQASLAVTGDEEHVYVLTHRAERLKVRGLVDVYRADDGIYLRSLRLPTDDRWTSLAVSHDALYVAGARHVVHWPKAVLAGGVTSDFLSKGRRFITMTGTLPEKGETT